MRDLQELEARWTVYEMACAHDLLDALDAAEAEGMRRMRESGS